MKGVVPQGAVVLLLLLLASSCLSQETLDDSQTIFDSPVEGPTDQIPENSSNQRQSHSRLNQSRQLFRYRNIGQNSLDNQRRFNSVDSNPEEGGLRPNSRIGFLRRLDRFRNQEISSGRSIGPTEDATGSQQSQHSDTLSVNGEVLHQGGNINPLRQVSGNQNNFGFTGNSGLQNNNEHQAFQSQVQPSETTALTSGDLTEEPFSPEGGVHVVEATQVDGGDALFLNDGGTWQDPNSSPVGFDQFEESQELKEATGDDEESSYPRVRLQPGPNRGRKRFRGQNRRRLMRLRRPWFLRRKMRYETQQGNLASEGQDNISGDQGIESTERIIDPSTLLNPSEKAQRILLSSEGSNTLERTGDENAETSPSTYLPDPQSSAEGFREQKSLGYENESSNVQEFFSNNGAQNENESQGPQYNTDNQNDSFRRFPNANIVRPRLRKPSFIRGNNGFNRGNSFSEADARFSGNNVGISDFQTGLGTQNQPNTDAVSNDRERFDSGSRTSIPVRFTTNRQQFSNAEQNINSDLNQSNRNRYAPSKPQEFSSLNQIAIQQGSQETQFQGNVDSVNENEFTLNQQNQRRPQSMRSPFNNNERLHQFQQQIESKRLLQYPQQQNNGRPTTDQSQERAQQRQQILEEKRLLQYPQSLGRAETFSPDISENKQEDSRLWQSPESQGGDASLLPNVSDNTQEDSRPLQYHQTQGRSESFSPDASENNQEDPHLFGKHQSQGSGETASPLSNSNQEHSQLLQYRQSQGRGDIFSPDAVDNRQRESSLLHIGRTSEQAIQSFKLQQEQRIPVQPNQRPASTQNLVDRYFKPAQLTDTFGPGRTSIYERKRQQSQQQTNDNRSTGFYQVDNTNSENLGISPNSGIQQQNRVQNTGVVFSSMNENESAKVQTQTSLQGNENNKMDHESLTYHEHQEGQQQQFSEQINQWPTDSHTDSGFHGSHAAEEEKKDNKENFARIPGRINPSGNEPQLQRTRINTNTFRTQTTLEGSQGVNNFNLNANNAGSQNIQNYDQTAGQNNDNYQSSTTDPQNSQLQTNQFSSNENHVNQSNIQRIHTSNRAEQGFETSFAQGNTYLPHQYSRFRQSRLRQNQSGRFQSRIQNNGGNTGFTSNSVRNEDQFGRSGQQSLVNEGHISGTTSSQSESEAQDAGLISGVLNERQNQNFGIDQGQQFSGRDHDISDQISKQTLTSGEAFDTQQSYSQGNEHLQFSNTQFSSGNQHSTASSTSEEDQQSTLTSNSQQGHIFNTEKQTQQRFSGSHSNAEGNNFQSQDNNGNSQEQQVLNFQTSDGTISSGNFQTLQQNLNQDFQQQKVELEAERKTSFDQRRFGANSYSSQRRTQLSSSQRYLQEAGISSQNQADQNSPSIEQKKISNAHGQPGFTFQRNLNLSNRFSNQNVAEQSTNRGIQIEQSSSNNQNYRSQNQEQLQQASDTFRNEQNSARSDQRTFSQQQQIDDRRQSSFSTVLSRGNRKFLDTFEGLNTGEPNKNVLERIAAVLQGKDYTNAQTDSVKLQRISGSPRLTEIPETGFRCEGRVSGYYADSHELAKCQSFHFCGVDGTKISYLCPAGTVFNQRLLVCDHVFRVECSISADYYYVNERLYGANVHESLQDGSRVFSRFGRRT
ncbi:uncharacterized protein DDB_G0283357-like [Macrobrachium nipponense]|uniref:uncharacterized protein DDB_G0283357-like n=1 Tax=Macrobrachium nipponense TaxID=159736 RepID=UPI0030C853D0